MATSGRWRVTIPLDPDGARRIPPYQYLKVAGSTFHLPARFPAHCVPDDGGATVDLDIVIDPDSGKPLVRAVTIQAQDGADPIDAKALRVPLPFLTDRAVDAAIDEFGGLEARITDSHGIEHTIMRAPADARALAARPRTRRPLTAEHLDEVARIYNAAVQAGEPPVAAVMNNWGLKGESARRNTHRWIKSARLAGLIKSAARTQGRAAPKEAEQ